ncbi:hypothetical protein MLD38_039134 [Melastoma candidum]|uniref:Uncharacterized protein n=1 Tax=Melastoma candidum TaxID=119954 RepID=A0ACB9L1W9_9MYRT|nr:hypothetical protein MLD38_039134 [Melastoma candidum]
MYGSDLDTFEYGSGFPRANDKIPESVDPTMWNEYCANSWNLNNLPKLKGSMLHSVHQNIAGVMVPWLYVGMLFSSFCWHFEDHCFYSMNYLHWGEPKCWYSVPGRESNAFEKVMRMSLPDLFDAQPDLLFQLVTMLSPSVLKQNGVSVYTVLQEPGNFVVTFPRSFHGGFNLGMNCAEAVNFAPADWIPHGGLCADLYRLYRKPAVISHEELLFVAAKSNHSTMDSRFLETELLKLFMKERALRECLWKNGVVRSVPMSPRRYPEYMGIEEDPTCIICRQYLFLSSISCRCRPSAFVCLEHWQHICECEPRKHRLLYRHTLAELNSLICTLGECNLLETQNSKMLSNVSDNTCAVARKVDGGQPTLVELAQQWLLCSANALRNPFNKVVFQKLLKEAEQFLWAGSEMDTVRNMNRKLTEALSWAERVQNCLQLMETSSDSGGEVNRISDLEVAELLDCNPMPCHVPGVLKLKDYAEEAQKLAGEIEFVLSSPIKLPELEDLYRRSCNLQIYVHRHNELKLKISLVKDCIESARRYLAEKCPASISIDSLYNLNSQIIQLQLLHPEAKLLGDLVEKTESCYSQCADLLKGPLSLEDVERFLQQMDGFTVDVPELKLLKQYRLQTISWISRYKSIWSHIYERDNYHILADELSTLLEDGMSLEIEGFASCGF